jgi:cytochrome c oxidase assembly factor CtaG
MDQEIIANHKNLLSKKNIWSLDFGCTPLYVYICARARARTHTHTHTHTHLLTYVLTYLLAYSMEQSPS